MRDQAVFVALPELGGLSDFDGFCDSAAQSELAIRANENKERETKVRSLFSRCVIRPFFFKSKAASMRHMKGNRAPFFKVFGETWKYKIREYSAGTSKTGDQISCGQHPAEAG
jgi:hypothetical protein